jgi:ABC-2 type transport system permease protein
MPALIGIYCGLLWRFEHMGTNFNQIMVNSSPWKIVASKLLAASVMGVFTMLWIVVLYVLCGRLAGIDEPIPSELLEWVLCGFVGCVAVCAVQLFLSLVIRNFAVPIGLALVGGIVGLFATAKYRWYLLPYSLFSVGMRANNPRLELDYGVFFVGCGVFACLFYLLGVVYLKRSDVI